MENLQDRFSQERGLRMRIAMACGITHGAVSQWDRVPAERVLDVERVTGIPRHELRPDIYPPDERPVPTPPAEQFSPEAAE